MIVIGSELIFGNKLLKFETMIKNLFYLLGVATIAASCTKDNLENDINSDDLITMNISASMPDSPKFETGSRTVIDAVTGGSISLKWSETDTKAYALTLYTNKEGQQVMGQPDFPITGYSEDMKSVYFDASFNSGNKEAYFYYPYANTIEGKTKVLTIPAEQTKAKFKNCNVMISDKITPTESGDLSVTYKQLTSIVYVEVNDIPEGKTIKNITFFPSNDEEGSAKTVVLNKLTLGLDETPTLTQAYGSSLNPGKWVNYTFADGDEANKCMFIIYPPAMNSIKANNMTFTVNYTDGTKKNSKLSSDSEGVNRMLEAFNALKAGEVLCLTIPGSQATPAN